MADATDYGELVRRLRATKHRECEDGFYSCPKHEDAFGNNESVYGLPPEQRPCECWHDEMHGAAAAIEALMKDRDATIDETARFNRGWERRGEPYSNLEDEFECMGWMWANGIELLKDRDALRRRVAELEALLLRASSETQRDSHQLRAEINVALSKSRASSPESGATREKAPKEDDSGEAPAQPTSGQSSIDAGLARPQRLESEHEALRADFERFAPWAALGIQAAVTRELGYGQRLRGVDTEAYKAQVLLEAARARWRLAPG